MPRTRSKGAAGTTAATDKKSAAAAPATKPSASVYTLPAESDNPPKLFILPKRATPSARIVTLQHPRYNKPTRYLVCPEAGFFEFTAVAPPKSTPRSWLLQPSNITTSSSSDIPIAPQTSQSPTLHLATPLDPLFLLLPALFAAPYSSDTDAPTTTQQTNSKKRKRVYLPLDEHIDALPDPSRHLAALLSSPSSSSSSSTTTTTTRALLESRLGAVCDVVSTSGTEDGGDEDDKMYRVNERRLVEVLWRKAEAMVAPPPGESGSGEKLPLSMEERFVRRELEAPVLGVRRRPGPAAAAAVGRSDAGGSGSGSVTPGEESAPESQDSVASGSSVESSATEASAASTAATSVADGEEGEEGSANGAGGEVASAMKASAEVVRLQRLRVAFNFICSSYVAPAIAETLKEALAKAVNFKPLDEYLARLAELRQEAAAARATDFSRKRSADEDEDERAEKRRKKEAEDKAKKANVSRGVKELMKVNTSGMKKMSDFFKKKA